MSRFRVRFVFAAAMASFLAIAASTSADAILPQTTVFSILGQEVSVSPAGCPSGAVLDTFAGWNLPISPFVPPPPPGPASTTFFTLAVCRGALPASGSIPIFGRLSIPTTDLCALTNTPGCIQIVGSITFLSKSVSSDACAYHYALVFDGGQFHTTSLPAGLYGLGISLVADGALQLDYTGCDLNSATGFIGGNLKQPTPAP